MERALRLLLVGHGRMGQLIEALAPAYGCEVVGVLDEFNNVGGAGFASVRGRHVDVAVEFSLAAAFLENLPSLLGLRVNLVVGTTGWQDHVEDVRRQVDAAGVGAVVASNFSPGVNLFEAIVERAGELFASQEAFGAWVYELHHAAKQDAPSGTALTLGRALARGGFSRPIDMASTRAGSIPGTHTVGFDGPAETVTLTHTTRDRATFARGALQAARWVHGRRGWFTMRHVLGIE